MYGDQYSSTCCVRCDGSKSMGLNILIKYYITEWKSPRIVLPFNLIKSPTYLENGQKRQRDRERLGLTTTNPLTEYVA